MGKQQATLQQADSGFDDDFSSDLILPSGPLSLRLSKDRNTTTTSGSSRTGSMHHKRPHTSHSDVSASTSASGSSIIFSTSSSGGDYSTASESEDQREYSSSSGILHARLERHAQAQYDGEAIALAKDSFNRTDEDIDPFGEEDEDDERSSTLKANQLPADFAQQLALSKAQAALAKESSSSSTTLTDAEHLKSNQTSIKAESQHWEEDLIFAPQQGLSSSRLLSKKASFSSHISDAELLDHARSSTSHSQASASASANNKTSSCSDTGDEDFFDGIELPPSFGLSSGKDITPPSSVESKTSRKTDLQALLNQKLKNRAGSASSSTPHVASASQSTIPQPSSEQPQSSILPKKHAFSHKHVEKLDERFEDSFILEEPTTIPASRPGPRPSIQSSSSSRSLKNIPPSQSLDRLSPRPPDGAISSRSSSTRSNTTVRPSRSSLNLVSSPSDTSVAKAGSSIDNTANTSLGKAAARNATNMGGLRSRPSLSNLATTATTAASQTFSVRHHSLVRKQSAQALSDLARTQSNSSERPSSSLAHYAQPTRSSLARHHLPFATVSRAHSSSNSRPSSPFTPISLFNHNQDSRSAIPSTFSSGLGSFSRLTRPTIASSAKSHKMTGSDPSGRTSASLGMPVTSNPSSPLKSMRTFRIVADSASKLSRQSLKKPQQEFGDGSELDGFDDLPVNREKEKKFVKIPIRRRQSSGMGSVDSVGSQKSLPVLQAQASQYGSNLSARRERVDSAPEQLHSLTGTSKGSIRSSRKADVTRPALNTMKEQPKALVSGSAKRPGLKFIRNLSAAGLSKGQSTWHLCRVVRKYR